MRRQEGNIPTKGEKDGQTDRQRQIHRERQKKRRVKHRARGGRERYTVRSSREI